MTVRVPERGTGIHRHSEEPTVADNTSKRQANDQTADVDRLRTERTAAEQAGDTNRANELDEQIRQAEAK